MSDAPIQRAGLDETAARIHARWPDLRADWGLILGSGWGEVAAAFRALDSIAYADLPALGAPGVAGHGGRLTRAATPGGRTVLLFEGRRHFYEGAGWTPIAAPVYLLKTFGARAVLLTNAAGGARNDLRAGDLLLIEDHINALGAHPLRGPHDPFWGPRFPDMSRVYDPELNAALRAAARTSGVELKSGVYLAAPGPAYETPAEVRAFRALGADAIGMSTVPEAILAHAAGLRVAGLSCIANPAAGMAETPLTHDDVKTAVGAALPRLRALLTEFAAGIERVFMQDTESATRPGGKGLCKTS